MGAGLTPARPPRVTLAQGLDTAVTIVDSQSGLPMSLLDWANLLHSRAGWGNIELGVDLWFDLQADSAPGVYETLESHDWRGRILDGFYARYVGTPAEAEAARWTQPRSLAGLDLSMVGNSIDTLQSMGSMQSGGVGAVALYIDGANGGRLQARSFGFVSRWQCRLVLWSYRNRNAPTHTIV